MGIRRKLDYPVVHLEVSVLKAPMKRATLLWAHVLGISYVLIPIHLRMMTRAERTNIATEQWAGHRERLPQALEQVCSTAYR